MDLKNKTNFFAQIHDELVYEISKDKAESAAQDIRKIMESIVSEKELSGVPIVAQVSIGENWGEMKRIANSV